MAAKRTLCGEAWLLMARGCTNPAFRIPQFIPSGARRYADDAAPIDTSYSGRTCKFHDLIEAGDLKQVINAINSHHSSRDDCP